MGGFRTTWRPRRTWPRVAMLSTTKNPGKQTRARRIGKNRRISLELREGDAEGDGFGRQALFVGAGLVSDGTANATFGLSP